MGIWTRPVQKIHFWFLYRTGGFRRRPVSWCYSNLQTMHLCCHGNEKWLFGHKIGYTRLVWEICARFLHQSGDLGVRRCNGVQGRSQEFCYGDKRGGLGDGVQGQSPDGSLGRSPQKPETNTNFQLRRGTCTHAPPFGYATDGVIQTGP